MVLPLSSSSVFGAPNSIWRKYSIPTVMLNNGLAMPYLGFGTHSLKESVCERWVRDAISVGYRLIDTATVYGNEEFMGSGIKTSGINREELFITSKVWVDDSGYENAKKAFELSLNKLGTENLDIFDFELSKKDFQTIVKLDLNITQFPEWE